MKTVIGILVIGMALLSTTVQARPNRGGDRGFQTQIGRYAYEQTITLGTTTLTHAENDRDVLHLPACRFSNNKPVRALKLEIKNNDAEIEKLKVVFQNGEKQVLHVRNFFRQGEQTRWIDLNGAKRCLKKVIIIGDTDDIFNGPRGGRSGDRIRIGRHGQIIRSGRGARGGRGYGVRNQAAVVVKGLLY